MATTKDILQIEFDKLKVDIGAEYERLGMRASGDFKDSLGVRATDKRGQLLGNSYAEQLEEGRKSGKFPPVEAIRKWIVDKGIVSNIKGNISVSSLAFLIGRKISKQGWKREGFGGVNLISNVLTPLRIQEIINNIGVSEAQKIVIKIEDQFKILRV